MGASTLIINKTMLYRDCLRPINGPRARGARARNESLMLVAHQKLGIGSVGRAGGRARRRANGRAELLRPRESPRLTTSRWSSSRGGGNRLAHIPFSATGPAVTQDHRRRGAFCYSAGCHVALRAREGGPLVALANRRSSARRSRQNVPTRDAGPAGCGHHVCSLWAPAKTARGSRAPHKRGPWTRPWRAEEARRPRAQGMEVNDGTPEALRERGGRRRALVEVVKAATPGRVAQCGSRSRAAASRGARRRAHAHARSIP